MGGLVTEWLGHVPKPGEAVERGGIRVEVLAANDRRVEEVRVSRVPRPSPVGAGRLMPSPHRTGFVSIAGRPNAGKSTLLNALDRRKACHYRPSAANHPHVDPGRADHPGSADRLCRYARHSQIRHAVQQAHDGNRAQHAVRSRSCLVCGGCHASSDRRRRTRPERARQVLASHSGAEQDRSSGRQATSPSGDSHVTPNCSLSAKAFRSRPKLDKGVEELLRVIQEALPEGPPVFPEDYITDQPLRFMAAEIIREQLLRLTHAEVPHAVAVLVDTWEDTPRLTKVAATIYVERPGQKVIVIGTKGRNA